MEYTYFAVLVEPAFPFLLEPLLYDVIDFDVLSRQAFLLLHVRGGCIPVDEAFPENEAIIITLRMLVILFGDPNTLTTLPVQF